MPTPISLPRSASLGLVLLVAGSTLAIAQVPTRASEPRLIPSAQPAAQVPSQPTVAAPAAEPAAEPAPAPTSVNAAPAPGGVTQLPPAGTSQPTSSSSQAATAKGRTYAAGNFGLTLEGVQIGSLKSVEGGAATAEVVVEKAGPGQTAGKHLAGVRYENISLATGLQAGGLNDWISATWKGTGTRKNGSIQAADHNYAVVSEREFMNALMVETTMPTLDGSGREMAHITVRLAPEYTRVRPGSGARVQTADARTQKSWLNSNFRFELDGLDGNAVGKIDSFTVRQTIAEHAVGEMRDYEKAPGAIEFPNLRLTLDASRAQTWENWHEDFVVKGNNDGNRERSGAIVYLDPTRRNELGRVTLSNCGIFRLSPVKADAAGERSARLIAELYCERMDFSAKGS